MIEIPLSKGYVAIVDDDCPPEILTQKWYAQVRSTGNVYASRSVFGENGRHSTQWLHRVIVSAPAGFDVDHIDGNGLNNQHSNLRVCTRVQNSRNRALDRRSTSGLKGAAPHRRPPTSRNKEDPCCCTLFGRTLRGA